MSCFRRGYVGARPAGLASGRGEGYEHALHYPNAIRVAINHEHVDHREGLAGAREIALFPPMTGG